MSYAKALSFLRLTPHGGVARVLHALELKYTIHGKATFLSWIIKILVSLCESVLLRPSWSVLDTRPPARIVLDFRQAQSAAERSGVASPHCWSLMLPTSARVAQEVYEPLLGIQYPMLCSRLGDTWQTGTTSIRED